MHLPDCAPPYIVICYLYSVLWPKKNMKYPVAFLFQYTIREKGHAVAQLIEALCYKPEGRGFDSR
jgi:hypothetical protein